MRRRSIRGRISAVLLEHRARLANTFAVACLGVRRAVPAGY
ncbi:MAG TPA: hypothetical protein VF339_11670 [Gammaproteobacteria bacterium]